MTRLPARIKQAQKAEREYQDLDPLNGAANPSSAAREGPVIFAGGGPSTTRRIAGRGLDAKDAQEIDRFTHVF
jgi:hypothetical protein